MEQENKFTQGKIVKAYKAISIIKSQALTTPVNAKKIWNLWKIAQNAYEFQAEEEKKLIDKYHGEITNEQTIRFKNKEDADGYQAEWEKLADMEIEETIVPVVLKGVDSIKISAEDINSLEGLIEFED